MKIKQLTIDDEELKEAVRAFLKTKGIDLPIHSVTKDYSWKTESEVTFAFEVDASPPIAATIPEAPPETTTITPETTAP